VRHWNERQSVANGDMISEPNEIRQQGCEVVRKTTGVRTPSEMRSTGASVRSNELRVSPPEVIS